MKVLKWLDENLEQYALVLLLAYITFVTGLQVFMRYVVGSSLTWSEESIRYAFIWLVFLGISLGVKQDKHISVLVVYNLFSQKMKFVVKLSVNLIFLLFSLAMTYAGSKAVLSFAEFEQFSPVLEIPMHYIYAAAPVGFGLTSIRLIQIMASHWRLRQTFTANAAGGSDE